MRCRAPLLAGQAGTAVRDPCACACAARAARSGKSCRGYERDSSAGCSRRAGASLACSRCVAARTSSMKVTPEDFERWQAGMVRSKLLPKSEPYEAVFVQW